MDWAGNTGESNESKWYQFLSSRQILEAESIENGYALYMPDERASISLINKKPCYAPVGEEDAYDRSKEAAPGHG